jgi:GNAT superfamily N-acetyltransferase
MDISFQAESFDSVFDEMLPLLRNHYFEVAHFKDIDFEPDVEMYAALYNAGVLKLYTARSATSELIGYAAYFVRGNLHYKSSKQAVQDVIYIAPERRGFGSKFIKWCDEQLKSEGVQAVYHHVKAKQDWGPMLMRMGYEKIDIIYARRLDKE